MDTVMVRNLLERVFWDYSDYRTEWHLLRLCSCLRNRETREKMIHFEYPVGRDESSEREEMIIPRQGWTLTDYQPFSTRRHYWDRVLLDGERQGHYERDRGEKWISVERMSPFVLDEDGYEIGQWKKGTERMRMLKHEWREVDCERGREKRGNELLREDPLQESGVDYETEWDDEEMIWDMIVPDWKRIG